MAWLCPKNRNNCLFLTTSHTLQLMGLIYLEIIFITQRCVGLLKIVWSMKANWYTGLQFLLAGFQSYISVFLMRQWMQKSINARVFNNALSHFSILTTRKSVTYSGKIWLHAIMLDQQLPFSKIWIFKFSPKTWILQIVKNFVRLSIFGAFLKSWYMQRAGRQLQRRILYCLRKVDVQIVQKMMSSVKSKIGRARAFGVEIMVH